MSKQHDYLNRLLSISNAPGGATALSLLIKTSLPVASFFLLLLGCGTMAHTPQPVHDAAHTAREPIVDIAVNLGLKYDRDLLKLYDSLASEGVRCGMRAMSLGAEQIVVEREDFDRAQSIVKGIIVRDGLTVRVFESADFATSPATSLLEVWEKGKKVREETYRLYFD